MSAAKKPTAHDCAGCRNDFYNHNAMGLNVKDGKCACWSLADATFEKARDIPIDLRPPYKHIPITVRPSCYKRERYVRVKPDRLDDKGFWR